MARASRGAAGHLDGGEVAALGPVAPPPRARPGRFGPAGQCLGTCHESSQVTISWSRSAGPSVNGHQARLSTAICTQTRPSVLIAASQRTGARTAGISRATSPGTGSRPDDWAVPAR